MRTRIDQFRSSYPPTPRNLAFLLIWIFVLIASWVLLFPWALVAVPTHGLDPSWAIGLQLMSAKGARFGQDVIFTFGPLGYLATKLPIGASKSHFLIRDFLVVAATTWMLLYVLLRTRSVWHLFLIFSSVLVLSLYNYAYTSVFATFLFLFWIFAVFFDMRQGSLLALVAAGAASIVTFYMKLNTGFPLIVLTLLYLAYQAVLPQHHSRRLALISIALYIAALLVTSWALNTDLPRYVQSSLYVISGHNTAMYRSPGEDGAQRLLMAAVVAVAFLWAAVYGVKNGDERWGALWRYGLVGVFLFIIFKHAFVRADDEHSRTFFIFAPSVIGLAYVFERSRAQAYVGRAFVTALLFSFAVLSPPLMPEYLLARVNHVGEYIRNAQQPMPADVPDSLRASGALPEDALAAIGDAGVDIMPWEISAIYANGLNYNPRPTLQSYGAYNTFLDEKNSAKYAAEDAPTYILYYTGEIDNRHPFSTETLTKMAMLANYEVIQRFHDFLLLQRRKQPRQLMEHTEPVRLAKLGETIPLDSSTGIQIMTADIDYSPLGWLAATLYQPSPLNVTVIFPNGEERTFRAVKGIANGNMLVSPFVETLDQAAAFFEFGQARAVAGVRFDSPAPWAYQKDIAYQVKTVDVPPEVTTVDGLLPVAMTPELTLLGVTPHVGNRQLSVAAWWQGDSEVPGIPDEAFYTGYAHLVDDQMQWIAGADVLLQPEGENTFSARRDGQRALVSRHQMALPPDLAPGTYGLLMGAYYLANGEIVSAGSVLLTPAVTIE